MAFGGLECFVKGKVKTWGLVEKERGCFCFA